MKKQCVVRTYPGNWTRTIENLSEKLNDGWVVVFITPLQDSITEYILEKEFKSQ